MKAILAFLLTIALLYFLGSEWLESIEPENFEDNNQEIELESDSNSENNQEVQVQNETNHESENETADNLEDFFLHEWIGRDAENVYNILGDPDRIDETPFGYKWLVYTSSGPFKMIGVHDNKVVTTYTNSEDVILDGIAIGGNYETISSVYSFEKSQTVLNSGLKTVTFELTEQELLGRPLVKIKDGIWAQLYFDTFNEDLSSVRYINEESLIKHRAYSMTYSGEIAEAVDWGKVNQEEWVSGQELQILELTNGIREKHGLSTLEGHEQTSEVAYLHSKDMHDEKYFSHTSPSQGELSDRLEEGEINYKLAGENIAAHYVDGIEAVEGWLNSEGHRVNLLKDDFTHLGVGVYRDYYTQNFLTPR
ncbi:CAP domain-containing protein [Salipaludibacillus sp. CF4.18]|uniref:CAP domain-containing protein n=1 Tax=Salipaludibacillus sp. CF4.18 TaxID=3373081 RepID=UPI003EE70519